MKTVKNILNILFDYLETITFIGSLFIVAYLFIGFPTGVQGASMEPTLHTNDRIFVSKISYKLEQIKRGDVIVIQSPTNPDIWYIKRAIALPKDTILFKDNHVYVNSVILEEPYITIQTNVWENGMIKENIPYTVPDDSLFILGDNRPRSSDSREFGPIPLSSVVGKAIYRYFPPDKMGFLNK